MDIYLNGIKDLIKKAVNAHTHCPLPLMKWPGGPSKSLLILV